MSLETDLSSHTIAPQPGAPSAPAPQPAEPTPPPAASPSPAQPSPSSPPAGQFSLREFGQQQGLDLSQFQDDRALASALFNVANQYEQVAPLADIGRQFAPYAERMSEIQEFLAQKDREAQEAAAAEAAKNAPPAFEWNRVQEDPSWRQHCRINEQTGRWEAIHPDWSNEARQLNAAADARANNSRRLVDDMPSVLEAFFGPRETQLRESINEQVAKIVEQKFAEIRQAEEDSRYIKEHEKDLFVFDATGNQVFGQGGQSLLTPKGQALAGYINDFQQNGVTNIGLARQYAERLVAADEAAGKFGQPKTPTPGATPTIPAAPASPMNKFLSRVVGDGRTGQRGGRLQTPDDTAPRGGVRRARGSMPDLGVILDEARRENG